MAQLKGRKITVQVSPDDTAWSTLGEMNSADMSVAGNTLDVTKFGDDDVERILGLRDCSWSFSGFYDPTDTNGQVAAQSSLLNDTPLYVQVQFNPGGTSGQKGFKQQVIVSKLDVKATVADTVTIDLSCDGTGAITAV